MLDRDGFRPNVGIILLNQRNQVFWGKRMGTPTVVGEHVGPGAGRIIVTWEGAHMAFREL